MDRLIYVPWWAIAIYVSVWVALGVGLYFSDRYFRDKPDNRPWIL